MKDKTQYEFKPFESKSKKSNNYLRLTDDMMKSTAWQGLSCHAIALYVSIKIKYNFTNENNLSFTYEEGKKLMDKKTVTKTLDELIAHGFIHIVRQGYLKECSIYGLSSEWQYYGTQAFKVIPRIKRKIIPKG